MGMKLRLAKILKTTWREDFFRELGRLVRKVPVLSVLLTAFTWALVLAGSVMATFVPRVLWMRGDILGTILFGAAAAAAIVELLRLPGREDKNVPTKIIWSLLLPVPFLGILLYWVGYQSPEAHTDHGLQDNSQYW
jgi:hypothetical protein